MPFSPLAKKVARGGAFIIRHGPGEGVAAGRSL
jgi:hypothetical protein